ncbi:Inositol-1-monophosphatase [Marinomonas spartinae]|uniref:Inositol-1-monophosphatase n=1 Tax=Marinomonas spartinae TaxID=1792290 RepID=A0A1A8TEA7_9GAMM|nr:inositol monophosphatase [Marinomonas spartinae]SBS31268.1 Inositol-1-monophosphatase [Marinomonas spartinae]SBS32399.1 Inositol-1-monophosphatase [Marinomonas spartinae]
MVDDITTRESALKSIIQKAGNLALQHFRSRRQGDFTLKGQQDFLTEADALVEEYIRDALFCQFPHDGLLGEETGGSIDTPSLWVVDPIDGTANFARGIEHFCVSIAFVHRGVTHLGAIYNPASNELYLARRGRYVTKNDQPLRVSSMQSMTSATIELGWSNRISTQTFLEITNSLLQAGVNIRRGASGALALAWVAEGRTDGYVEQHMAAWDCLAGLLMVEEAGGRIGKFPENHEEIAKGGPIIAVTGALANDIAKASHIELNNTAAL